MPLNKPTRGELSWDIKLNAALDYLDAKAGVTGPTGAAGATGPTGAASTVTGPTGPAMSFPNPVSYTPIWSGIGLAQSSNLATGSYFDYGRMVVVQITVPMTNVTNFGTGGYSVTLPKPSAVHSDGWGGTIHDTSTGNFYSVKAHLEADSNVANLWYISGVGQDEIFDHNSPVTLATNDLFHINFIYNAVVS